MEARHCVTFSIAACRSACCSGVRGARPPPPRCPAGCRALHRAPVPPESQLLPGAAWCHGPPPPRPKRGHRRRARQGFAMVRHQLGFAQANLDIRLDDGFRIRAGDAIEAVGDGADLDAAELRVDHLRAKRPGQRHGRQCDLSQISSCEFHLVPFHTASVKVQSLMAQRTPRRLPVVTVLHRLTEVPEFRLTKNCFLQPTTMPGPLFGGQFCKSYTTHRRAPADSHEASVF